MDATRIDVTSERSRYTVAIGAGLLSTLPAWLDEQGLGRSLVVVSCPPVWRLHGKRLAGLKPSPDLALIPDGERAKRLPTVARIYDVMVEHRLDRSAGLIAFGLSLIHI